MMTFGVQKHRGPKQVGLKQLGSKQVGFKQLGHKQVGFKQLGPDVETEVHGVQDEKRVWFEVELQRAQGDREAEGFQQEKVHLGIKVRANITVTEVPEQEGAEGNVVEKKKVKDCMRTRSVPWNYNSEIRRNRSSVSTNNKRQSPIVDISFRFEMADDHPRPMAPRTFKLPQRV
ncbi:hypothetical protein Tco_1281121 [Tanacetum coccineum]